jgi:ABC-type uncharacterized transport system YnjBCD permease subunit
LTKGTPRGPPHRVRGAGGPAGHHGYLHLVPKPLAPLPDPPQLGVPLRAAAVTTGVEAVALAAAAIGLAGYQLAGHRPQSVADSWGVVAMAVVGAVALGLVVRGLAAGRRWARSPAVLAQLIVIPVAATATGNGAVFVGVPLVLCGLVGLVGLFAPSTTRRFSEE